MDELKAAFAEHGGVDCVLEKMVDLRGEISVIVCRLNHENVQTFDPAENIHENGILAYSIVPARLSADVQQQARQMAQRLADELDYVGVLAVEIFVVGDTHELVVNEIAPRPATFGRKTAANRIGCRCKAIRTRTCTCTAKRPRGKAAKWGISPFCPPMPTTHLPPLKNCTMLCKSFQTA